MEPVTKVSGKTIPFPFDDVDTDQIIPAEFLKTTKKDGLGIHLFGNWRYDGTGRQVEDFVLNRPAYRGASILVAGANFGIGSSREHAVWALLDYGIKAVLATSFGDIFYENAARNGLVLAQLDPASLEHLRNLSQGAELIATLDLEAMRVLFAGTSVPFSMKEGVRRRLMSGLDEISYTLEFYKKKIEEYERLIPQYRKLKVATS
jgi:3-isopropylmalate/(R)-2-methylmalate dehydratase small subunit